MQISFLSRLFAWLQLSKIVKITLQKWKMCQKMLTFKNVLDRSNLVYSGHSKYFFDFLLSWFNII